MLTPRCCRCDRERYPGCAGGFEGLRMGLYSRGRPGAQAGRRPFIGFVGRFVRGGAVQPRQWVSPGRLEQCCFKPLHPAARLTIPEPPVPAPVGHPLPAARPNQARGHAGVHFPYQGDDVGHRLRTLLDQGFMKIPQALQHGFCGMVPFPDVRELGGHPLVVDPLRVECWVQVDDLEEVAGHGPHHVDSIPLDYAGVAVVPVARRLEGRPAGVPPRTRVILGVGLLLHPPPVEVDGSIAGVDDYEPVTAKDRQGPPGRCCGTRLSCFSSSSQWRSFPALLRP